MTLPQLKGCECRRAGCLQGVTQAGRCTSVIHGKSHSVIQYITQLIVALY